MSEGGVTYDFKELFDRFEKALTDGFSRIDHRFDELNRRLDGKADIAQVAALEKKQAEHVIAVDSRFNEVDKRFKPLELAQAGQTAVSGYRRFVQGGIVLLASGGVGELIYLLVRGGHS